MKISRLISNEDGLTLIEVIVSIAILGIVTAMGFMIINYNTNSFTRSSEEMIEQSSLRLASYKLTDEFRNIGYIDLANNSFASETEIAAITATDYFVFKTGSGIKKGSAASIFDITDTEIVDISFELSKRVYNHVTTYYLGITLTGKSGEQYATEVLLNNIITDNSVQMDSGDIGLSGFRSIRYNYNKPPED